MPIELDNKQSVTPPAQVPVSGQSATPDELAGVTPASSSAEPAPAAVSSSSVVPPSEQAVPADAQAQSSNPPPATPDMSKILEAARQMPVGNAYTDAAAPATAEAKLENKPHHELIAAYVQQFNQEKRDPLAELVAITDAFNKQPTGKLENALKTEFLLTKMSKEQIGQIPSLIDEGKLAFTNEQAFKHVKQHRREMKQGADAPVVEVALLKHAIAAASMNGQYGVVSDILSSTTREPLKVLENTFRDIEAQSGLISPVTGKPYADILASGIRADINAIGQDIAKINEAKAKQEEAEMDRLRAEAEAENAARDAAKAAQQAPANPAQTATPQSSAPASLSTDIPAQPTANPPSWAQTVGGAGALDPAKLNPAARAPLTPGR